MGTKGDVRIIEARERDVKYEKRWERKAGSIRQRYVVTQNADGTVTGVWQKTERS